MVGLTSYQIGAIVGSLIVPAILLIWMIKWLRAGNRLWWIPMTLLILAGIGYAGQVVRNAGLTEPGSTPSALTVRSVDPLSVFHAEGYAFEPLDPEGQAVVDGLKEDDVFGVLRQVLGRQVLTDAGIGVGSVIVYEFEPRALANPSAVDGFFRGVEQDAGVLLSEIIAGMETRRFSQEDAEVGTLESVIWQEENLFVMITALTKSEATKLARAIITRGEAGREPSPTG